MDDHLFNEMIKKGAALYLFTAPFHEKGPWFKGFHGPLIFIMLMAYGFMNR